MRKAHIITYGCQMNYNESAKMANMLKNIGYEMVDDYNNANLVLINTCTVREGAAVKVYSELGRLKELKEQKDDFIIGVTGCLAQEEKENFIKRTPYVDLVLGNQNIAMLPDIIDGIVKKEVSNVVMVNNKDILPKRVDADFSNDISASIAISYGCNNYCTFCIVPHVRGKERSVPLDEILDDVKKYVKKGFKEILFLGQNVNSYGNDFRKDDRTTFANLLKESANLDGDYWIKYISPHPKDFNDEVIKVIKENSKIARMLHLPLQSGSTRILKKMKRGYTKEQFLELALKIKKEIPDIALTTDIIVGFPSETEEDFKETLDVVEKVGFENAFMFMYSKRKNTPASNYEEQIDEETKNDRLQRLMRLQDKIAYDLSQKYIGKTVRVLIEGESKKNKDMLYGRTSTHKIVLFPKENKMLLRGHFVKVKITHTNTWTLYGELEKKVEKVERNIKI